MSLPDAPHLLDPGKVQATEPNGRLLSPRSRAVWRAVQIAVWLVGIAIFALLVFAPPIGIHAFWNVLIPVAPALLALAPGLWRNVCPLGSTALFPRHMGFSARRKLSANVQGWLAVIGLILLFGMVPLRHVFMDLSGPGTALAIGLLAVVAVCMGLFFEWKSGWCSGLCPVHPVEKLYGSASIVTPPNVHCGPCARCVSPCPDSTVDPHRTTEDAPAARRIAMFLMIGAFPGFVWGWFQIPDYSGGEGWAHLPFIYGLPLAGAAATLLTFLILTAVVPKRNDRTVIRAFAAAALGCYYWFRLPALFGFGVFPGDGMLVDLSLSVPGWFPWACHGFAAVAALLWWVGLGKLRRTWSVRPPFEASVQSPERAG